MTSPRDWTQLSDQTLVAWRVEKGVAVLTLTDPPANTYSYAMMRQLDDAILRARFDEAVHVIVITGSGSKFFCAGANIQMLGEVTPGFKYFFCLHANETLSRLEQTNKLVIAAINGHCVGGGLEVALAADIRFAAKGDFKLGLPEVNLGVLPGTGGTQRLARLLGRAKALELMLEGKNFDVATAQALGLVNKVASGSADFLGEVLEYAAGFVPPRRASMAVGHIKRAVLSGLEVGFTEGLALERELQQRLFVSADAKEGIAAFNEKRTAVFQGAVKHPFFQGLEAPLHSSHRGGAALYPENTMAAFRAAVQVHRTDLIELDVRATRDGEVVVAHDETLDRCTDAHGPIRELTWDQVSKADAAFRFSTDGGVTFPRRGTGVGIPRLRDVLDAFPSLRLNVEVKSEYALAPFVALMKEKNCLGRLCLGSEHDALAARLVEALPDGCFFYPRDALVAFVLGFKGGEVVDDPRYTVLDMPLKFEGLPLFDRALADEAARREKWINVWTVDDPAEMKRAIDEGVGGVMTDRPDLLREVIDARAIP